MSRLVTIGIAILGFATAVGCGAPPTDSLASGDRSYGGANSDYPSGASSSGGKTTGNGGSSSGTTGNPGTGSTTDPGTGGSTASDGGTGSTTPTVKAKDYYVSSVHSALATQCGGCHASGNAAYPQFMTMDAQTSYAKLDSYGMIVSKEASKLPNHGAHTGPAMDAALLKATDTWLDLEAKERGTKTGGPTLDQVMTQFGSCITLAEFTAKPAGKSVADIPLIQTTNRGACQSCHSGGGAGFWASADNNVDLKNNQTMPFLGKLVSASANPDGTFTFTSDQNRVAAKQTAAKACADAGRRDCHPNFPNDISAYVTAIKTMTDSVAAKMKAGQCGPMPAPATP